MFLGHDEFLFIKKEDDKILGALMARIENILQKLYAVHSNDLTISTFKSQLAAMVLIHTLSEEFTNFKSSVMIAALCWSLAPLAQDLHLESARELNKCN